MAKLWPCVTLLAMTGLVCIGITFTIVDRAKCSNGSKNAIMCVMSRFPELVSIRNTPHQLHEVSGCKLTLRKPWYAVAGVGCCLSRKDRAAIHSRILFRELIPIRESASTFSKLSQWSEWVAWVKCLVQEGWVVCLNEIPDRQCRRTSEILNRDFKRAADEIRDVFSTPSFSEANGRSNSQGFDTKPRTVASRQSVVGCNIGTCRGICRLLNFRELSNDLPELPLHHAKLAVVDTSHIKPNEDRSGFNEHFPEWRLIGLAVSGFFLAFYGRWFLRNEIRLMWGVLWWCAGITLWAYTVNTWIIH